MTPDLTTDTITIPGSYMMNLVKVVSELGGDANEVLQRAKVKREDIMDPHSQISFQQFRTLLLEGAKSCQQPALGLYLGSTLTITSHGILGYAVMSSANVRAALELAMEYFQLRTPLSQLSLSEQTHEAKLTLESSYPQGDIKILYIDTLMSALVNLIQFLTQHQHAIIEIQLDFKAPDYQKLYAQLLGCKVTFEAENNVIIFSTDDLDTPLPLADESANKLAVSQCESMLRQQLETQDLITAVKKIISRQLGDSLDFSRLASQLNRSKRTLRRHLLEQGSSYQKLVDEVRFEMAKQYLLATHISIHELSYLLGFSDPSNFGRAFKKWSGISPKAYRNNLANS